MTERHEHFSADALRIIELARQHAIRLNHKLFGSEHLLMALLDLNDMFVVGVLTSLRVAPKRLRERVDFVVERKNAPPTLNPYLDADGRDALDYAQLEARELRATEAAPVHVLLGLLREQTGFAGPILESSGLTLNAVRDQIIALHQQGEQRTAYALGHQARCQMTPMLNMVSRDLTSAALAGQLDPLIGREDELERTIQILSRRTKNNPVLIGPAGVGKTAIVEGLAQRIVAGQAPEHLLQQRVVALEVGLLTIGTKYRGDFEERLKKIVAEIVAARNLIIVVDELHTLIGAGVAEGSVDAANLLKPILARGEFRCVGTTTFDDYRKTIERDPALERRFQPITVRETTTDETLQILIGLRSRYEAFHRVTITPGALRAAVTLSVRYIQDRQLPDKAVDVLDEAAARVCVGRSVLPAAVRALREKLESVRDQKDSAIQDDTFAMARALWKEEQRLRAAVAAAEYQWTELHQSQAAPVVGEAEIATVVAAWAGVPAMKIDRAESERLLHLEDELHRRVVGQERAVTAVARAIRRSRAELRDRRRPIGTFVFAGPTGVGKTEVARSLAAALFGDEQALITFDMSEFGEAHYAARLLGAPPGYVGYDQAGQLTEAVRRRPYSVVLFDEIEKAHHRVFDLLLQVTEDGYLSDAKGRKVDFRNTVIILTSNIGAQFALRRGALGFEQSDRAASLEERVRDQVQPALRELFRPELLNRLDDVIIFHPLSPPQVRQIAQAMVQRVVARLAEQHIECAITDAACDLVARRGYDQEYGARPLRRAVQQLLEDELAERVLRGEFRPGDRLTVDADGDHLSVEARLALASGA